MKELDKKIAAEAEVWDAHNMSQVGVDKDDMGAKVNHRTKVRKETQTWNQRVAIIMFYLHPFMGEKNLSLLYVIYGVKKEILKDWLSNHKCVAN